MRIALERLLPLQIRLASRIGKGKMAWKYFWTGNYVHTTNCSARFGGISDIIIIFKILRIRPKCLSLRPKFW